MQKPLRERLRSLLMGFTNDYFYEAWSADKPTRKFFKQIVLRSRNLLEALDVQTEKGKKFLPIRTLSLLEFGGKVAIEDSVVPGHLTTGKDNETRLQDLRNELASVIDVIETLEISARYAARRARTNNTRSSLGTDGRMNEEDQVLYRLACIYSECWSETAGYKKDSDGEIIGPFIRFFIAVLGQFNETHKPKSIASRIDRLKRAKMI